MAWKLIWTEDDAGVADGLATLNGIALVVQDPANATLAPTAGKIPKADGAGKLDVGWLPTDVAGGIPSLDGSKNVVGAGLVVSGTQVVGAQAGAIGDPAGGVTIDLQCRDAVTQILSALRGHGLIA